MAEIIDDEQQAKDLGDLHLLGNEFFHDRALSFIYEFLNLSIDRIIDFQELMKAFLAVDGGQVLLLDTLNVIESVLVKNIEHGGDLQLRSYVLVRSKARRECELNVILEAQLQNEIVGVQISVSNQSCQTVGDFDPRAIWAVLSCRELVVIDNRSLPSIVDLFGCDSWIKACGFLFSVFIVSSDGLRNLELFVLRISQNEALFRT